MKISELGFLSTLNLVKKCNDGDYKALIDVADQCDLLILNVITKKIRIPCSTNTMDQVYRLDQKSLNHTPRAQHHTREAIGKGIITSDNEDWKKERQKVQGMFGVTQMEMLYAKIQKVAAEEIQQSKGNMGALHFFTNLTLQVTGDLLFGNISKEDSTAISESTANMIKPVFRRVVNPFYWISHPYEKGLMLSKKKLFETVGRCIENARMEEADNLVKKYFPTGYQTESILNVLTAGFETTSTALTWMFIELSKSPQAMQKVKAEVAGLNGELNYKTLLEQTPFIQACFNEAIRLYPPIWLNGRITTSSIELNGHQIPKGSDILLSPYLFHHLPKYWTEPERFLPDRFIDNKMENDAYIPFGQGARSCIGARLAILKACLITTLLLKEFDLHIQGNDLKPHFHFTLRPPESVNLELKAKA